MIKFILLPIILVGCTAPVTDPPAHAFELEVEESHWNNVYRAIEYIKQNQYEKKRTSPEDALNNALGDFNWEVIDGSNGST